MKRCILVILGPGASGKSTLTRTLCGPIAREFEHAELQETYVLAPREGFAVPGTLKNGSDSIGVVATRAAMVEELLKRSDVRCVVLDWVRSSRRWDVDWVQAQGVSAVYASL